MTHAPVIVEELKQERIPVYAELATGYLEAIEIKVMMNLLKVIDNPRQDIPLASVLKSTIVGLDEEELAKVRLVERRTDYYDALIAYVKQAEAKAETARKLEDFLTQLKDFQFMSRQGALSDLIR